MGLFRKSKKPAEDFGHARKLSTYDVHDPILTAIRDDEPFQMSANTRSNAMALSPEMQVRDVFGNPIQNPDRSNPTRPRNERPLDTIRAFEYACTGDERLRDEMETPRLGWNTRSTYPGGILPRFDSNPYAVASPPPPSNMISFNSSGDSAGGFQSNSFATTPAAPEKKKKRGLFGRRKK